MNEIDDKTVLMLGGSDDGKRITPQVPLHQGALLRTFRDRPMSMATAATFINGDLKAADRHRKLDEFVYRVVEWRVNDQQAFVAIDDSRPDEDALILLINGYAGL